MTKPKTNDAPPPEPAPQATVDKEEPVTSKADDELLCTFCGLKACWTK